MFTGIVKRNHPEIGDEGPDLQAQTCFEKAASIFLKIDDRWGRARVLLELAWIHQRDSNLGKVSELLIQIGTLAEQLQSSELKGELAILQAKI